MKEISNSSAQRRDYRCSFCGKSQDQVKRLIAGQHNISICDQCIDLCYEIVHEGETHRKWFLGDREHPGQGKIWHAHKSRPGH